MIENKLKESWNDAYRAAQIAGLLLIVTPLVNFNNIQKDTIAFYFSLLYAVIGIVFLVIGKKIKDQNEKVLTLVTYVWGILVLDSLFSLFTTKNYFSLFGTVAQVIIFVYLLNPNKRVQEEIAKLKEKKGIK